MDLNNELYNDMVLDIMGMPSLKKMIDRVLANSHEVIICNSDLYTKDDENNYV